MAPEYLNLFFLILFSFWLLAIFKFPWQTLGLNRVLVLSFVLAAMAPIVIRYGNNVQMYVYGNNFLKDYYKPGFQLTMSHWVSVLLTLFSVFLLKFSFFINLIITLSRSLKRTFLRNIKAIGWSTFGFVLLCFLERAIYQEKSLLSTYIFGTLLLLFWFLFGFALIVSIFVSWSGVLAIVIAIYIFYIFIISRFPSLECYKRLYIALIQLSIALIILLHLCMPWFYPDLLEDKYKSGFEGGFAEAVKKSVDGKDIASIERWMAEQPQPNEGYCKSADKIHKKDRDYAKLPKSIQNLNPEYVQFCREEDLGQQAPFKLILSYYGSESLLNDRYVGLVFVYPPTKSNFLENEHDYLAPISDDCNCYIAIPFWWRP